MNFNSPITCRWRQADQRSLSSLAKTPTTLPPRLRTIVLSNSNNSWQGNTLVTGVAPMLNGFAATNGVNTTVVLRMGANNALPDTNLFLQAATSASVATLDLAVNTTIGRFQSNHRRALCRHRHDRSRQSGWHFDCHEFR